MYKIYVNSIDKEKFTSEITIELVEPHIYSVLAKVTVFESFTIPDIGKGYYWILVAEGKFKRIYGSGKNHEIIVTTYYKNGFGIHRDKTFKYSDDSECAWINDNDKIESDKKYWHDEVVMARLWPYFTKAIQSYGSESDFKRTEDRV